MAPKSELSQQLKWFFDNESYIWEQQTQQCSWCSVGKYVSTDWVSLNNLPHVDCTMGKWSVEFWDENSGVMMKIQFYPKSVYEWETVFYGYIPDMDFFNTLYHKAFALAGAANEYD